MFNKVNLYILCLITLIILLITYKILPQLQSFLGNLSLNNIGQIAFGIIFIIIFCYNILAAKQLNSALIWRWLAWLLILIILVIIYAFKPDLITATDRVIAVLIPSYSWDNIRGELIIARSTDGHFYVNAYGENNSSINFLIDTGASDIALTKADAENLGINLDNLRYTERYNTANGLSYAAPVTINQLKIGKKIFYNLKGHVSSGGLDVSLLGISLLKEFSDFNITRDMLILKY